MTMPSPKSAPPASLRERIAAASQREDKQQSQHRQQRSSLPSGAFMLALRIGGEITAGIVVGGFIGWALDTWLATLPLFMILFLCLGGMAGMLNVWRAATGKGLKIGYADAYTASKPSSKPTTKPTSRNRK